MSGDFQSEFDREAEVDPGWAEYKRQFCINRYKLSRSFTDVKRAYRDSFCPGNERWTRKPPTLQQLKSWAMEPKSKKEPHTWTIPPKAEEQQNSNKLIGSQWGRKTGENRVLRKESISSDIGLQLQAVKWTQRDIKWNGRRPVDKKEKKVEPVEEEPYYYYESEEEEVKPDRKQVMLEKFEEKVLELIESLDARGHAARMSAFVLLRAELKRRAVNGLLDAHRATLADHVSRALRRGKDAERKAAAAVAPLLALQICEDGTEQFVGEVRPALSATATDKSASIDTRIECCSSLAALCYLVEDDLVEILEVMRMYETIFSGSYLKDDGSVNVSAETVEEGSLHAAALDSWALLFSLLPPNHALSLLNNQEPSFARLGEMLEAVSVEVRLAAGAALAIAYETVSDDDNTDNALTAHVDLLLPLLIELSQDKDKYRAKKDRKILRVTFREILKYFKDGEEPSISARIGSETASWSSWSGGAAYAALAGALGGALQVLVPHCRRLRAALALSNASPEEMEPQEKPKKLQRHLMNRATAKARHFNRSRNRDKRSAALAI